MWKKEVRIVWRSMEKVQKRSLKNSPCWRFIPEGDQEGKQTRKEECGKMK